MKMRTGKRDIGCDPGRRGEILKKTGKRWKIEEERLATKEETGERRTGVYSNAAMARGIGIKVEDRMASRYGWPKAGDESS